MLKDPYLGLMARFGSNFGLGLRVGHGWYPAAVVASLLLLELRRNSASPRRRQPPAIVAGHRHPHASIPILFAFESAGSGSGKLLSAAITAVEPSPTPPSPPLAVASPLSRSTRFRGLGFGGWVLRVSSMGRGKDEGDEKGRGSGLSPSKTPPYASFFYIFIPFPLFCYNSYHFNPI